MANHNDDTQDIRLTPTEASAVRTPSASWHRSAPAAGSSWTKTRTHGETTSMHPNDDETENFKRDCLARYVMALQPLERRRKFLARFQRRHGKAVADDLKARITAEWKKRRRNDNADCNAAHAANR